MTATTQGGWLLVMALTLPAGAMLLAFVAGGRHARTISLAALGLWLVIAFAIAAQVQSGGAPLSYVIGGWQPPLGMALRADGLSAAMLLTGAVVLLAVALFGRTPYDTPRGAPESRAAYAFWCFVPALAASLAAAFLGGDLFNLFVALEMLTFTALALACLDGRPSQFKSELRYLLFALIGSVLYLLGTGLLYGAYGTLDIALLAGRTRADAPTMVAGALMTAGLIAKMALFPLHLWLPPAHAGAPAAASALLSGLVVKGAFVLLLRLWFWVLPAPFVLGGASVLAALGATAIVVGSVVALRQERLKLLVAYSTVAQMGYLFLMFPLLAAADAETASRAWLGGVLQAISHALAKAAMFLGAGLVAASLGHDRVNALGGAARAMPVTVIAFALGGLSLMGLPPSGGFSAKWLLLRASVETGQWWWSLVILAGGLLTGGYVYRIVAAALSAPAPGCMARPVPRAQEYCVLALAVASMLLGVLPLYAFGLVRVGAP
ncbi:complex I subunit 5 family protein [Roseomonas sp. AR75]|uniref:complex I subunit 5 family protein n=1 Tax=Roseomonas sp. AR75 TaxID=2562311 RepID=UPI001F0E02D5|nr:proton-conducting transporter membrane subunit [Roseomonas sp. AR75]